MFDAVATVRQSVAAHVGRAIVGKEEVASLAVISLLCGGHMLIDDVPGTGKTVLAKAFARALSLEFRRVQCVPDMLPSDLVGVNFFDLKQSEFRFIPGPVFTNILLVDEINRAMPKTQAGLLECMEEHQVSLDGVTYPLREPFMVIATQNPVEAKGTFELPEAQLDRFLLKTPMGYPPHEESLELLSRRLPPRREEAEPLPAPADSACVAAARAELEQVYVHPDLLDYAAQICEATRTARDVALGASPRAMIALVQVARGWAALQGRDWTLPDDVKRAAVPVLAHRLVFRNDFFRQSGQGEELVRAVLDATPVPSEDIDFGAG